MRTSRSFRCLSSEHNEEDVIQPVLFTIRSIVTESDTNADSVLAAGAWPLLAKLLVLPDIYTVQLAAEIASTIAVNHVTRSLVDVQRKGNLKCQKEAAWDITNITLGNSFQFVCCRSILTFFLNNCRWQCRRFLVPVQCPRFAMHFV